MRLVYTVFLLAFISKFSYGQGLIDEAKTWNVMFCCFPTSTKAYKLNGDTTINMKLYKKLFYSHSENFEESNKIYAAALREEDQQVYINYSDTVETRLYDFRLTLNDTFTFINDLDHEISICVDSIDSVEINGELKKRLIFRDLDNYNYESQIWIEGIGSSYGLLEIGFPHIPDLSSDLLCVKDENGLLFQQAGTNFCYSSTVSMENIDIDNTVKVFPNPSNTSITIEIADVSSTNTWIVKIYDTNGTKLYDELIQNKRNVKIDLPKKGVYIIEVTDKSNNTKISYKVLRI